MKKTAGFVLALILILSVGPASAIAKYLDFYQMFYDYAYEGMYDDLIQAVVDFRAEHPLLMPADWEEKIISISEQARDNNIPFETVRSVLWDWTMAVNAIVDKTIIPSFATRMIKNNHAPIYPSNIQTEDYWKFQEDIRDEVLNLKWELTARGNAYFLPCQIKEIHEADSKSPYAYWYVVIMSEYGRARCTAIIITDYAIQQDGWIDEPPEVGDTVLAAVTYSGRGNYGLPQPVFFLGFDQETIIMANDFSK